MADSVTFSLSSLEARVSGLEAAVSQLQTAIASINTNVTSINSNLGGVEGYGSPNLTPVTQTTKASLKLTPLTNWMHQNPEGFPNYSTTYSPGSPNIIGETASLSFDLSHSGGGAAGISRIDVVIPQGWVAIKGSLKDNKNCPINRFSSVSNLTASINCPMIYQDITSTSPILYLDIMAMRGKPWVIDSTHNRATFAITIKRVSKSTNLYGETLSAKVTIDNYSSEYSVYNYTSPAISYNVKWGTLSF